MTPLEQEALLRRQRDKELARLITSKIEQMGLTIELEADIRKQWDKKLERRILALEKEISHIK